MTRRRTKGEGQSGPRYEYEDETSVYSARGSVSVAEEACWLGEVVVPMMGVRALIHVERRPPSTGPSDATLAVPVNEVGAVLALLEGVVAQARRDHVLPPQRVATRGRATTARRHKRGSRSTKK